MNRLAERPGLARILVINPEQTLAAEGLQLTSTELAMLTSSLAFCSGSLRQTCSPSCRCCAI